MFAPRNKPWPKWDQDRTGIGATRNKFTQVKLLCHALSCSHFPLDLIPVSSVITKIFCIGLLKQELKAVCWICDMPSCMHAHSQTHAHTHTQTHWVSHTYAYSYSLVNIFKHSSCVWNNGMFFEVEVLKVGIHVETLGSKVESATDVWNNALTIFSYEVCSHPHVPVPLLQNRAKRNKKRKSSVNSTNIYKSPLDEDINQGPSCVYTCKTITYTC